MRFLFPDVLFVACLTTGLGMTFYSGFTSQAQHELGASGESLTWSYTASGGRLNIWVFLLASQMSRAKFSGDPGALSPYLVATDSCTLVSLSLTCKQAGQT